MTTNKPVPPTDFPHTERTRVTRKPDRGSYDRELIYSTLDQAFVCSIAFIADGLPIVVATN
jgi:nitroimidazol reductase NimA-like FMN-containing flavoprotein (pyridoxamine 5'-phosphate oxidase superfamily)